MVVFDRARNFRSSDITFVFSSDPNTKVVLPSTSTIITALVINDPTNIIIEPVMNGALLPYTQPNIVIKPIIKKKKKCCHKNQNKICCV